MERVTLIRECMAQVEEAGGINTVRMSTWIVSLSRHATQIVFGLEV